MRNRYLNTKEIVIIAIGALLSASACLLYSGSGPTNMSLAISFVFVAFSATLTLEQQLMLVALAAPNTNALGFFGISASTIVCAIGAIKCLALRNYKNNIPLIVPLFLVYSLQYYLRFGDAVLGFVMPIKTVLGIMFFTYLSKTVSIAKNSYSVGYKSSLAFFAGIVSSFWSSAFSGGDSMRMAVVDNDPNILAVEVAFVLSYLCVNYYSSNNSSKLLFLLSIIILSIISLFCGSRMGLILLAFVLVMSVLLNLGSFRKSTLLVVVFGLAIGVFLFSETGKTIIDALMFRSEVLENNDDVSNGRFEIWESYIKLFNSDPFLWFFGLGNQFKYGITDQAHNVFIEDIAAFGVIGMIMLYFTYLNIYKKQLRLSNYYNETRRGLLYKLPFLVPLIGGLTLHSYLSIMNITMLYLGVLCMTKPKES